jgi:hypothetical protein
MKRPEDVHLRRYAPGSNDRPANDCCSKSVLLHDVVIGLFVNRYEFGNPVSTPLSTIREHDPRGQPVHRAADGVHC